MPQPLGQSGSEPHPTTTRAPLDRNQLALNAHQHGYQQFEQPRHSALGLEGMTVPNENNMKPPTVGRQSWYTS